MRDIEIRHLDRFMDWIPITPFYFIAALLVSWLGWQAIIQPTKGLVSIVAGACLVVLGAFCYCVGRLAPYSSKNKGRGGRFVAEVRHDGAVRMFTEGLLTQGDSWRAAASILAYSLFENRRRNDLNTASEEEVVDILICCKGFVESFASEMDEGNKSWLVADEIETPETELPKLTVI